MLNIDIQKVIEIAKEAGQEILKIYHTDFSVQKKEDDSPLTAADQASHQVISKELSALYPDIPILSEEGKDILYKERINWKRFWLVDPLDGTKEFINRNGEFTVNIALIENGYPVLGVIYVPEFDILYYGTQQDGALKINQNGDVEKLKVKQVESDSFTIVESRSHPSKELEEWMKEIKKKYGNIERVKRGSSLKFCAVAEGLADLYPRLGPTMEWDTAAGQAIVEAAGGCVVTLEGKRLSYNKESLKNGGFLVSKNSDVQAPNLSTIQSSN
ncbi:3'(2'),5'-bisphosphate nucleotidase CysQ [Microaerobacter geothermalis]|uniref:3'(2'),5'-bisphosphate nucleotidase CysQ n=1 Tax=Microaerobacter geothermalis TaxID=674972 RepID=UPI001F1D643E|nr:3'(2'),5'-bisphosphate nucleotidase CysQ [Microaerobacter geothermalis]MCF6093260.1 3'(2'),5'-bisphosphate nucleotidase CysQ [Microaerobacter geothermalis]